MAVSEPGGRVEQHAVRRAEPPQRRRLHELRGQVVQAPGRHRGTPVGPLGAGQEPRRRRPRRWRRRRTRSGQSIQQLPRFMALADTTFVNLRNSLDALTPLVNASKPVAPKLQKFLVQLRPLAQNAVPTVRNLANLICSRGSKPCSASHPGQNDLIQLLELSVKLSNVTCGTSQAASTCNGTLPANGQQRLGAFPQSTVALNDSTPELATARPVRGRPDRLVRGLQPPGPDRRQRQRQPGRAGGRRRLDRERHARICCPRSSTRCCAPCSRSAAAAPCRNRDQHARARAC